MRLEVVTEVDQEVLSRYENSFGNLVLRKFHIIRHTLRGVWIRADGTERFILNTSRKRYAYPTEQEALTNFIKRTERHIMLAEGNLTRAKEALYKARSKGGRCVK